MREAKAALASADQAVQGLMGLADLMEADPNQQRIAAALRSLAQEVDESLGAACAEIDQLADAVALAQWTGTA